MAPTQKQGPNVSPGQGAPASATRVNSFLHVPYGMAAGWGGGVSDPVPSTEAVWGRHCPSLSQPTPVCWTGLPVASEVQPSGDLPVLMGHHLPSSSPPSCFPKLAQTHVFLCPLLSRLSVPGIPVRAQTPWSPPKLPLSPCAPSLPFLLTKACLSPAGWLLPSGREPHRARPAPVLPKAPWQPGLPVGESFSSSATGSWLCCSASVSLGRHQDKGY